MNAFLDEVAILLGAQPALSEMDREIIETMIEIGAAPTEIAETFGYAPEQIVAVAETPTLQSDPVDVLAEAVKGMPERR